jgi:hypothetical protein
VGCLKAGEALESEILFAYVGIYMCNTYVHKHIETCMEHLKAGLTLHACVIRAKYMLVYILHMYAMDEYIYTCIYKHTCICARHVCPRGRETEARRRLYGFHVL